MTNDKRQYNYAKRQEKIKRRRIISDFIRGKINKTKNDGASIPRRLRCVEVKNSGGAAKFEKLLLFFQVGQDRGQRVDRRFDLFKRMERRQEETNARVSLLHRRMKNRVRVYPA